MRIVAALGGNALLERGEPPDSEIQEEHILKAVAALTPLARAHELIITHSNGPQVGLLALESAGDPALAHPYPLDVLGAQTQGMIGYWLVQALQNALPGRQVACLVSQTLVSAADPAFTSPSKLVGPVYTEQQARQLADAHGWDIGKDGPWWRRIVPSPEPVELLDLPLICTLEGTGAIVICAGGGGVPVVRTDSGRLRGWRPSWTKTSPPRCWPGASVPTHCSCSRTSKPSRTDSARPMPADPLGLPRRTPHPIVPHRIPWDRKSKPDAASWKQRGRWQRSGGSLTPRRCSAGLPAP